MLAKNELGLCCTSGLVLDTIQDTIETFCAHYVATVKVTGGGSTMGEAAMVPVTAAATAAATSEVPATRVAATGEELSKPAAECHSPTVVMRIADLQVVLAIELGHMLAAWLGFLRVRRNRIVSKRLLPARIPFRCF